MAAAAGLPDRSDDERRKRLGQYFTGVPLARLLAALAGTQGARSVIDPMAGSGDMLVGALAHATPSLLGGVELDPVPLARCAARLQAAGVESPALAQGSAFSASVLSRLPTRAWDVVITNPPYVRYQSTSRAVASGIPSASETRRDLVATLATLDALDGEDKRLFRELARGYSGFADLAVPAWILCAGLVRVGGTLAMLVPTTWLSRDYAHPIRYLLRRWFDVTCVVEDGDASWFADALVRTTLVVATRVPRRDTAFTPRDGDGYVHLRIDRSAADERSLVGCLLARADDPEVALTATVADWRCAGEVPADAEWAAKWVAAAHEADSLQHAAAGAPWLERVERIECGGHASLPPLLSPMAAGSATSFVTLDRLGWRAGQGLRTGANKFFYLRSVESHGSLERLQPAAEIGQDPVDAPAEASLPALRGQADLPKGYAVSACELDGRVLVLDEHALPPSLTAHIGRAARLNVGTDADPKCIPELSAVVTNVRRAATDRRARFWYQLPPLTDRHRPALLIARVNNRHPRTLINDDRRAVVDANFCTLWPAAGATVDAYALLAALNSAWCVAVLELTGTVMGAGALKVEATRAPGPAPAVRGGCLGRTISPRSPARRRPTA